MLSRAGYVIGAIAIVIVSFLATLLMLDSWWSSSTSPRTPAPAVAGAPSTVQPSAATGGVPPSSGAGESSLAQVPQPETMNFSWTGVTGLRVQPAPDVAILSTEPSLSLTAVSTTGSHALIGKFTGLDKNRVYRLIAWVKPQSGANFELEARDNVGAADPANRGGAAFDLRHHTVIGTGGSVTANTAGVEQGPGDWQKVWIDITTADGQFAVKLDVLRDGQMEFQGDGQIGITVGGITANPQS